MRSSIAAVHKEEYNNLLAGQYIGIGIELSLKKRAKYNDLADLGLNYYLFSL